MELMVDPSLMMTAVAVSVVLGVGRMWSLDKEESHKATKKKLPYLSAEVVVAAVVA